MRPDQYAGNFGSNAANTVAGKYSPFIWGDCPWEQLRDGLLPGSTFELPDWATFPLAGTQTTQIAHSNLKVFATADGAIAPVSAVVSERVGAVLKLLAGTTSDNESLSIAQAYPSFLLSGLSSNSGKLWFEFEIGITSILTNTMGFFCGLAETDLWTLATGVPFNGSDAITNSASAIGFRKGEDALGVVDTVYSDRATSFTNIGDDETSIAVSTAAVPFAKFGIKYDPNEETNCVQFYKSGVKTTTSLTRTALRALTNLDANALGFIFAQINDSGADGLATYVGRGRIAQLAHNA